LPPFERKGKVSDKEKRHSRFTYRRKSTGGKKRERERGHAREKHLLGKGGKKKSGPSWTGMNHVTGRKLLSERQNNGRNGEGKKKGESKKKTIRLIQKQFPPYKKTKRNEKNVKVRPKSEKQHYVG